MKTNFVYQVDILAILRKRMEDLTNYIENIDECVNGWAQRVERLENEDDLDVSLLKDDFVYDFSNVIHQCQRAVEELGDIRKWSDEESEKSLLLMDELKDRVEWIEMYARDQVKEVEEENSISSLSFLSIMNECRQAKETLQELLECE